VNEEKVTISQKDWQRIVLEIFSQDKKIAGLENSMARASGDKEAEEVFQLRTFITWERGINDSLRSRLKTSEQEREKLQMDSKIIKDHDNTTYAMFELAVSNNQSLTEENKLLREITKNVVREGFKNGQTDMRWRTLYWFEQQGFMPMLLLTGRAIAKRLRKVLPISE
jgi:hypothetical protein